MNITVCSISCKRSQGKNLELAIVKIVEESRSTFLFVWHIQIYRQTMVLENYQKIILWRPNNSEFFFFFIKNILPFTYVGLENYNLQQHLREYFHRAKFKYRIYFPFVPYSWQCCWESYKYRDIRFTGIKMNEIKLVTLVDPKA